MKSLKKFLKNQIALAILLASLILAGGIVAYALISKNSNGENSKAALLDSILNQDKYFSGIPFQENEYLLGNPDNNITLLIYSDPECPFCKMLHNNTVLDLEKKYILNEKDHTKAKIGIVYRHFALSFHTQAPLEINALLCARELYGQSAYLNMLDRIYEITPANNGLDLATLPTIAEYAVNKVKNDQQNLKKEFKAEEFQTCYNQNTYNAEFEADQDDALKAGLDGTPYALILYKDKDNQLIVQKISGARDINYFTNILDKLLKIK